MCHNNAYYQNQVRMVLERYQDVQIYTDYVGDSELRCTLLCGGMGRPNPKEYMDNVVSAFVGNRGHNQFIEIFLDNPYVRVILEGINSDTINWQTYQGQ